MVATFNQLDAKGFKSVTVSDLIAMAKPLPPKPSPTPRASTAPAAVSTPPVPIGTPGG